MKAIKVSDENMNKIAEAIAAAEGKATVRTITAESVVSALKEVFAQLSIPKYKLVGVSVNVDLNAQEFPKAYKYVPLSTRFKAEYRASGWYVTNIERKACERSRFRVRVNHTEASKEALIERFSHWAYFA